MVFFYILKERQISQNYTFPTDRYKGYPTHTRTGPFRNNTFTGLGNICNSKGLSLLALCAQHFKAKLR